MTKTKMVMEMFLIFWILTGTICFLMNIHFVNTEKIPMTKINHIITGICCLILGPFSLAMLSIIMFLDWKLLSQKKRFK